MAFEKNKSNIKNGKRLMKQQACIGCHSIESSDPKKGPDLNHIGALLSKLEIAKAILKPDATIANNWIDVTMNNGTVHNGTLVKKDQSAVTVRNIAGKEKNLIPSHIHSIKKSSSTIIGPHLLDSLTIKEFIDVVGYL